MSTTDVVCTIVRTTGEYRGVHVNCGRVEYIWASVSEPHISRSLARDTICRCTTYMYVDLCPIP